MPCQRHEGDIFQSWGSGRYGDTWPGTTPCLPSPSPPGTESRTHACTAQWKQKQNTDLHIPLHHKTGKEEEKRKRKKTISTFSLTTRPKTEGKTDNLYYMLIFATKLSQYLRFRLKLVKVEVKHRFTLQVLIHLHTPLSDWSESETKTKIFNFM